MAEEVDLRGQRLGRGDHVLLMLGSDSRDAAQFVDPDSLDPARWDNRHVAFS